MISQGRDYSEILTQIPAVNKALEVLALGLLQDHLRRCILEALAAGRPMHEVEMVEILESVRRLARS